MHAIQIKAKWLRTKRGRRRIIAVGTTSARVLESQPTNEPFAEKTSET